MRLQKPYVEYGEVVTVPGKSIPHWKFGVSGAGIIEWFPIIQPGRKIRGLYRFSVAHFTAHCPAAKWLQRVNAVRFVAVSVYVAPVRCSE